MSCKVRFARASCFAASVDTRTASEQCIVANAAWQFGKAGATRTDARRVRFAMIAINFVCLGNICRSPLARGYFQALVQQRGVAHQFRIASCGTGSWHVGKGADPRTMLVAAQHGLSFEHTARQVDADADVHEFDLFVAMDNRNKSDLIDLGIPRNRVRLLRSFDPACGALPEHTLDVPDPYYGGQEGFETMYQMIAASSEGLLSAALKGELPSRVAR